MQQEQYAKNTNDYDRHEQQGNEIPPIQRPSVTVICIWFFVFFSVIFWVFLRKQIPVQSEYIKLSIESMFNIALLILVVVQTGLYYRQSKALDAQTEISERLAKTALRQVEITDRPWLAVDVLLTTALTFDEHGGHLTVKFDVQNIGRSVAVNMTVNAKLVVPRFEGDIFRAVMAEQSQVCQSINSKIMSYAIFPERKFVQGIQFTITPDEIEQGRVGPSNYFVLYVVGCVDYQFGGHDTHHQTRFNYQVLRKQGALNRLENTPLESLFLQHMIAGGGDYAD